MFELFWTYLNRFELFKTSLKGISCQFLTRFDKSGTIFTCLDKFGQVWTSLDKFGQVWTKTPQFRYL